MTSTVAHAWLRRLSDYCSGGVTATERAAVEAHLSTCAECQQALVVYRRFDALVRSPLRLGDGGEGPLMEYRALLLEETMLTSDRATRERPTRQRPRTPLTALGAIAAVLLIALLAAMLFARFRAPTQPVKPHLTPTPTVAALTWRQAALPDGYALPGPSSPNNGFAISPADGQRAWACAPAANRPGTFTIWATHDAATTWQQVSTLAPHAPETPQSCELMPDQYDPHTLIAQVGRGYCNTCNTPRILMSLLSTDDGATWLPVPGNLAIDELATNNGTVFALIYNQTDNSNHLLVTITHDGGTMTVRQIGVPALALNTYITHVWMHPPDPALYAADTGGRFWRSDDTGAHWTAVGAVPGGAARALGRWIESQHHWLFCVPSQDVNQCSDDNGATWPQRLTQGVAQGCGIVDNITADGLLLTACNGRDVTPTGWFVLTRFAPGALASRQIGAVPSPHFVLTATGQIWGFTPAGDAVYVATLAG